MRIRRHLADVLTVILLLALATVFYRNISFSSAILVGYDTFTYFYPHESYVAEALRQGQLPLWNPYLFTGVPFLANPQTAIFYPLNLIFLLFSVPRAYAFSVVLHVALAGFFMYLLCRRSFGLGKTAALAGAVTFMFSGFVSSLVGHVNQLHAAAWIPLLFLLCNSAYTRRSIRTAVLAAVVLALQLTAGHAQESYLTIFGLALLLAFRLMIGAASRLASRTEKMLETPPREISWGSYVRESSAAIALFALVLILGVGLAAVQVLPSLELSNLSIRSGGMGYKEATSFSLPPWLVLKSLLPVFGDPQPFSEWLGYVGVFGAALAIFGLAAAPRRPMVWFALAMSAIALFFAFGQYNPFYPLAYKLIPGLKLFRVPARWIYLYTFAVSILAAYGLDYLGQRAVRRATISASFSKANEAETMFVLFRFFGVAVAIGLAGAVLYQLTRDLAPLEVPSQATQLIWLVLALSAIGTIAVSLLWRKGVRVIAPAIVVAELLVASQGLDLNQTVHPEAYSAMRPAVAHFLADKDLFRVLPVSDNTFDPGDMAELKEMLRGTLTEKQIYDYIVATKWKETLIPNLPLRYRIASVDGYDGGILPLLSYVELKRLFPLREQQAPDGRLREELEGFPDAGLLSLLNIKYVLLDRVHDAWVDGVYYDLALSQKLDTNGTAFAVESLPSFETTSLGVISYLSDAATVPNGQVVAWVTITDAQGVQQAFPLRAGMETAEGKYQTGGQTIGISHGQARKAKAWKGDPAAWDYFGKMPFPSPAFPRSISVRFVSGTGSLVLRGLSLIDDRTQTSVPIVLSPALELSYLGDVKIYRNRNVWPRAFVVARNQPPSPETGADAVPPWQVIRIESNESTNIPTTLGKRSMDEAQVLRYEPERIEVKVSMTGNGFLVLTDSYYPGWHAIIDGVEKPILKANRFFRAVELSPGEHLVQFNYEPQTLRFGALITLLSMIVALTLLVHGDGGHET